MNKTAQGWMSTYKSMGALWIHDGNPKRPHALLTSGNHSGGFFNSELVMEDSLVLDEACSDLVELVRLPIDQYGWIDRVVGPAMGAITLADGVARYLAKYKYPRRCRRAYTEKDGEGENLKMVFKRTSVINGEIVLLCEDVITTGGSVERTAKAVTDAAGKLYKVVVTLVNRSGLTKIDEKKIIALIDHPMPMWKPDECPLCKQGSEAIKPKGVENWKRLNAEY
jgi:orotate phosphoribosyltransferase